MNNGVEHGSAVHFHRLTDEFGAFTNFSRHPVLINGIEWKTCEHYYQASKFTDPDHVLLISQAPTPSRARTLGRTPLVPLRPDWDTAAEDVMRTAMRAKFVQHPQLARQLLLTGSRILIETTKDDWFWGAGHDGTGLNITGRILTEIRTELATDTGWSPPSVLSRRWVTFGDNTIVLPRPARGKGDLPVRALRLLQQASTREDLCLTVSAGPDPQMWVEVPKKGEVLLRTPPSSGSRAAVALAMARAAAEPITMVHDPSCRRP